MLCKTYCFAFQKRRFCTVKAAVLHRKTYAFAMPNRNYGFSSELSLQNKGCNIVTTSWCNDKKLIVFARNLQETNKGIPKYPFSVTPMGLSLVCSTLCNTVIYIFILSFGIIGSLLQALYVILALVCLVSVIVLNFVLPNCCFVW